LPTRFHSKKQFVLLTLYDNALERFIFRNLAALKSLQESRANAGNVEDDLLKIPASILAVNGFVLEKTVVVSLASEKKYA